MAKTKVVRVSREGASLKAIADLMASHKSPFFEEMPEGKALDRLLQDIQSGHDWYLAKHQSSPAGFLHAFVNPIFRYRYNKRDYEIQVVVLPEYGRRHIASDLVHRVICDARKNGINQVCAYILSTNEPSKMFFASLGFHIEDEPDEFNFCQRASFDIN